MIHELHTLIFLWFTRPAVNWPDTWLQKNKCIEKVPSYKSFFFFLKLKSVPVLESIKCLYFKVLTFYFKVSFQWRSRHWLYINFNIFIWTYGRQVNISAILYVFWNIWLYYLSRKHTSLGSWDKNSKTILCDLEILNSQVSMT